jgi:hypothetical protein
MSLREFEPIKEQEGYVYEKKLLPGIRLDCGAVLRAGE